MNYLNICFMFQHNMLLKTEQVVRTQVTNVTAAHMSGDTADVLVNVTTLHTIHWLPVVAILECQQWRLWCL